MDVDASQLQRLLDLQGEDAAIRRLEHQRESLPEAQRLAELTGQLGELDSDIAIARKQHDETATEQARLEAEMATRDAKIEREEGRLYSGSVSNPKELNALRAEIEMLKRQRSELEEGLLEAMVQRDGLKETLDSLEKERAEVSDRADELSGQVSATTGEIDAELKQHTAARGELIGGIPKDLVVLYEKVRDAKHGVGAARLVDGMCEGCHTKLPAKEVERLRAERGLQRCDNCRRILVVA
ncbi:MAG: zinc ribbon domain-containing protein [Actinomycetota bacterium]